MATREKIVIEGDAAPWKRAVDDADRKWDQFRTKVQRGASGKVSGGSEGPGAISQLSTAGGQVGAIASGFGMVGAVTAALSTMESIATEFKGLADRQFQMGVGAAGGSFGAGATTTQALMSRINRVESQMAAPGLMGQLSGIGSFFAGAGAAAFNPNQRRSGNTEFTDRMMSAFDALVASNERAAGEMVTLTEGLQLLAKQNAEFEAVRRNELLKSGKGGAFERLRDAGATREEAVALETKLKQLKSVEAIEAMIGTVLEKLAARVEEQVVRVSYE